MHDNQRQLAYMDHEKNPELHENRDGNSQGNLSYFLKMYLKQFPCTRHSDVKKKRLKDLVPDCPGVRFHKHCLYHC